MGLRVAISPGHGGKRIGAVYDGVLEKDLNLSISLFLDYELKAHGFESVLLREKDEYVQLSKRVYRVNTEKIDLFISIHCDALENPSAIGATTFIYDRPGINTIQAARLLKKQFIKNFPKRHSRGVERSGYYVLEATRPPAILFECGFMSNPDELRFLKKAENQKDLAVMIRMALDKYRKYLEEVNYEFLE